jgi:putative salt-induced outer membrane protein YdiY
MRRYPGPVQFSKGGTGMPRLLSCLALAIVCVCPAGADELKLANGDTINGEIVEWAVEHVVIDHPQLGRVRLSLDQLAIDTGKPPSSGLFGTSFLRGWKRSIDLGFNGRMGNSLLRNITLGLDFSFEDAFRRWKVDGRYFYNEDDDGVGDNNAIFNLHRDWLNPGSRWFARSGLRYQFDEFESWEHRINLIAGPGYHLVNREAHKLDVVLSPSFTREFGERQGNKAEALIAFDYSWKPGDRYEFSISNQSYIEVKPSAGELRNMTIADLKISLLEKPALSFKIGAQNEYETDPEDEDENNDIKYYLSFGLNF